MVEIKTAALQIEIEDLMSLLERLRKKFSDALREKVAIKYSGDLAGPMAPAPYYTLVVPRKTRIGPFEFGKNDQVLMAVYPTIYGRSRDKRDMFCSLYSKDLEPITLEELKRFGEYFEIDTIYLTEIFDWR